MNPNVSQIGSQVKVKSGEIKPLDQPAGTVVSAGVDRLNPVFNSAVLLVLTGTETGSPSARTVDAKIQHSDDNSAWSDYTPPSGTSSIAQITAVNTLRRKDVDLAGAKRYVRSSMTVGFTAGTTPKIYSAVALILGGAQVKPVGDV